MKKTNLPLKLALRNILVQPTRALMSVVGVIGCVALLVTAFGIKDTVDYSLDNELNIQFEFDVNSTYLKANETELFAYLDDLFADYESYQSGTITATTDHEETISIYLINPESTHTTIKVSDGIVMSKSTAKKLGISSCDSFVLANSSGSIEVEVSSLVETSVTSGIFMSEATFNSLFLDVFLVNHLWINLDHVTNFEVDRINELNGTNGAWIKEDLRSSINDSLTSINTIRNTMVIFSILLSVVVLYNFALLNMIERIRDIATLKVLGLYDFEIGKMLIYEMMILVVVGTGFGLLLGYPVLYLVMSNNEVVLLSYIYYIRPISYFFAASLSLFTAFVFNIVFTVYIRRIPMVESLKSIE